MSINMFYEGVLLVGTQIPSSNPATKFIVTKCIVTKFLWVRAGHRPTTQFACKY